MTYFWNRPAAEQELVNKAYAFEKQAIESLSSEPNPYKEALEKMGLWEALQEAIDMAYN